MQLQILARKKFQGFNGILSRTNGLFVSAAVLYQLSGYEDPYGESRPEFIFTRDRNET